MHAVLGVTAQRLAEAGTAGVAVSTKTDRELGMFLASQGGGRTGDLSRFIEEAVRAHCLELRAKDTKEHPGRTRLPTPARFCAAVLNG